MAKLPVMVNGLLQPTAYPEPTTRVRLEQTQMSFVFLTDGYAYKVKKPVDLGYLDYTTLEKRLHFCNKELELNRRLCANAYLGVVKITRRNNSFVIGGEGGAIEYAVKMRRLPAEHMMDSLLEKNGVTDDMIDSLAERIAVFHRQADTNKEISAFGDIETIIQNTEENFSQTDRYIGKTISRWQLERIMEYTRRFIAQNKPLFEERVREGHIRDCHGDLHTAHICFEDGICIYDCIEFNDRFRYGDVAAEVAFLAMDLDHHGHADLSRSFVNKYIGFSGDEGLKKLLPFYKCYRAYIRGKVACFKLDDPYIRPEERRQTRETAAGYFDLACAYIKSKPSLFITVGLVGSGKSTLAQALAKRMGMTVISSDVTRKRLASVPRSEHRFEEFDSGIYSPDFSRRTYDTMFILDDGGSVVLDASFIKATERQKAAEIAAEAGAQFFTLECNLDEELTRQRLDHRLEEESVSDGRWEIYQLQQRLLDSVCEIPLQKRVIIDTSQPVAEIVRYVLDRINEEGEVKKC